VKIRDGSLKIVFFSDSIEITKSIDGAPDDLETGKSITASGAANSEKSITAQTIQLRQAPQIGRRQQSADNVLLLGDGADSSNSDKIRVFYPISHGRA